MSQAIEAMEENMVDTSTTQAEKIVNSKDQMSVDLKEIPNKIRHYYSQYTTEFWIGGAVLFVLFMSKK
jgi:uncharacterized protein YaaQ